MVRSPWVGLRVLAVAVLGVWRVEQLKAQNASQEAARFDAVSVDKLEPGKAVVTPLGERAFRFQSQKGEENAAVRFSAGKADERRDWSPFGGIAFDAGNLLVAGRCISGTHEAQKC